MKYYFWLILGNVLEEDKNGFMDYDRVSFNMWRSDGGGLDLSGSFEVRGNGWIKNVF